MAAGTAQPWSLCPSDLEPFVESHLRRKENFLEELRGVASGLVSFIRKCAPFSVLRFTLSGDLPAGITAAEEEGEFQLTLYVADFRSIDEYQRGIQSAVASTRDLLTSRDVPKTVATEGGRGKTSDDAMPIRLFVDDDWYQGRLVLGVDLIGPDPSKSNKETMFRRFTHDHDKSPYQPTLDDIRQQLLEGTPQAIKDVILLVRHWRKYRLRLRGGQPTTRFFDLLVIHCWERAGNPELFDLGTAVKGVLTALSDWRNISIIWEESDRCSYPRKTAEIRKKEILSSSYDGPLALDPIDPRLEYCACVKALIWNEISRTARETISEPLLETLSEHSKWY